MTIPPSNIVEMVKCDSLQHATPKTAGINPTAHWVIVIALLATGCLPAAKDEVVIYTALDKEFSEPILAQFEKETGIKVRAKYDQESNKTVGLANAILQQGENPRCDLFWNNEVLHTERLKRAGVLQPFDFANQTIFPAAFRDPERTWQGFAARARVLIVNTQLLPDRSQWPTSVQDLADPKWKGRCTLARPMFGTSATHAAVLFQTLGRWPAEDFYSRVKQVAVLQGGNKQVAVRVAEGQFAFGLTDTDDAIIELAAGRPIEIVFPDQAADQPGTLFIPNTLSAIRHGDKISAATQRLIDHLLSPQVEEILATGPSAQFPLNSSSPSNHRLDWKVKKQMPADFGASAKDWEEISRLLEAIFPL